MKDLVLVNRTFVLDRAGNKIPVTQVKRVYRGNMYDGNGEVRKGFLKEELARGTPEQEAPVVQLGEKEAV